MLRQIFFFIRRSSDRACYVNTQGGRACMRAGRWTGGDICCPRSHLNTLCPILSKHSTTIYDYNISAIFDYQRSRISYSRVTALDLQKLLNTLLVRTLTSKSCNQPTPNFIQMLKTIVIRPWSIATWLALVTQELWFLIYRSCSMNYLYKYIRKSSSRKRNRKHKPISKAKHTHTHTTHSYHQSCTNSLKIHVRHT